MPGFSTDAKEHPMNAHDAIRPLESLEPRQLMAAGPILSPQATPAFAPHQYALADLNADGKADLATLAAGRVRVGLGNGDATFQPAPQLAFRVPDFQRTLAAGDFNGDGRDDLAALGRRPCGSGGLACPRSGMITLALASAPEADAPYQFKRLLLRAGSGGGLLRPIVGDFNGDGADDLGAVNQNGIIAILIGLLSDNGPRQRNLGSPFGRALIDTPVAGDFNGDDLLDLAALTRTSTGQSDLQILPGSPNGVWDDTDIVHILRDNALGVAAGDINGDGLDDLALMEEEGIVWMFGDPDRTLLPPADSGLAPLPPAAARGAQLVDISGDGDLELAALNARGALGFYDLLISS
jgi:hypothetical protein